MSSAKARRKIWKYFIVDVVAKNKANCIICHQTLQRGGKDSRTYRTSALINRLRFRYLSEFTEYLKASEIPGSGQMQRMECETAQYVPAAKKRKQVVCSENIY